MGEVWSRVDPTKPTHVVIIGKKGSGKSVLARSYWASWPFDRLVLDVNGDDVPPDPELVKLTVPLPTRWPQTEPEKKRSSLRFKPDMGSETYLDDLDRALGLAYGHRRTLFLAHEMGELFHVNRLGPFARRALHQGRHAGLSMVLCGPRPITVDPLVLAQADVVHTFRMPNPDDRRRVADAIGWDPREFDEANAALKPHHFLTYDARSGDLLEMPPIPLDWTPTH